MRKVIVLAALVTLAACGEKKAAAPANPPAASGDSMSGMQHDSTMARDTTKKP
jgi:predicted small lipoprotein YifL